MSERNQGLIADALFVGATRPAMRWGVTYTAILINMMVTMEIFLLSRSLLTLLLAPLLHGVCVLLCARDPRFFDLVLLWVRSRVPAMATSLRYWHAASYGPLPLELPDLRGRRRQSVLTPRLGGGCSSSAPRRGA
jgi:type IV secretion system protein VirB3